MRISNKNKNMQNTLFQVARHAVLAVAVGFTPILTACAQSVEGSGKLKSETRNVNGFHSIDASGSYDIILVPGKTESLTLEADDNILPLLVSEVKNGKLELYTKIKGYYKRSSKIKATVHYINLDEVEISGSGDIKQAEKSDFNKLKIEISGSGDLDLNLNAKDLKIECSGSGDIKLKGSAEKVSISVSGSANINNFDLAAKNCNVEISGSGDANLNVSENLDVSVSGSGSIRYKGNAKVTKHISGSGSVKQVN